MEKSKNTIKVVAIIVALVLLLGMVIGGAIWGLKLLFNNDANTDSSSPAITNSQSEDADDSSSSLEEDDKNSSGSNGGSTQSSNASKGQTTTISVDNISTKKGKKISVPVKVSSNQGFMSGIFEFDYDATALEYTGYKPGKLFSDFMFNNQEGKVKFITLADNDVKKDGVLVYLEFKVIDKNKTVPIKVTVNSDSIANRNEEYVPVKTKDGSVKIK